MRSMPAVNNLHNEKRPKRHTSDTRPHKRNKTKRGREKTTTTNKKIKTDKVEHKAKSPAQIEAKASELHPWRLELEIFPSRLPCGHPYRIYKRKEERKQRNEGRNEEGKRDTADGGEDAQY